MVQFTVESMSGGSSFDLSDFNLKLDDYYDIAALQAQEIIGKANLQDVFSIINSSLYMVLYSINNVHDANILE